MAYKTEKRPAKVGEKILIVEAVPFISNHYKNGDVLTVSSVDDFGDVHFEEDNSNALEVDTFIIEEEYEVIIGEEN